MKKSYKIIREGNYLIVDTIDIVLEEIKNTDIGELIEIEIVSLTDKEWEELPEFEGW